MLSALTIVCGFGWILDEPAVFKFYSYDLKLVYMSVVLKSPKQLMESMLRAHEWMCQNKYCCRSRIAFAFDTLLADLTIFIPIFNPLPEAEQESQIDRVLAVTCCYCATGRRFVRRTNVHTNRKSATEKFVSLGCMMTPLRDEKSLLTISHKVMSTFGYLEDRKYSKRTSFDSLIYFFKF